MLSRAAAAETLSTIPKKDELFMAKSTTPTPQPPAIREHWLTAPESVRANIQHLLSEAQRHGGSHSLAFVRGCISRGYDCRRDEIPLPLTTEVTKANTPQERQRVIQGQGSLAAKAEELALAAWDGAAKWRTTSLADERAERIAKAQAEHRQKAIHARAAEILQENQRAAERAALAQAEQEFSNV